jgi:hypothetical protein
VTLPRTRPIDWRKQFKQLARYLDGEGGVVEVRYTGSQCADNAFVNLLSDAFEAQRENAPKQHGVAIVLDEADHTVRYLSGIRHAFPFELDLELPSPDPFAISIAQNALSNNSAGRDQHIEIHTPPLTPLATENYHQDWIAALCTQLEGFLKQNRLMIVLRHDPSKEQAHFWSAFWPRARHLVAHGLLFVKMLDLSAKGFEALIDKTPRNCEITLPPAFDDTQVMYAIEDVAHIIHAELPEYNTDRCHDIATGYVQAKRSNVRELHDGLVALISFLGSHDD